MSKVLLGSLDYEPGDEETPTPQFLIIHSTKQQVLKPLLILKNHGRTGFL